MTNLSTCLVRRLGVFAFCVITSLTVQAAQNPALLVEESGLSGGIIVVLDNVEGGFLSDLAVNSSFLVQGLSAHKIDIEKARQAVQARGLYGQVSCNQYNGSELPYVDDLINLVLCEESTRVHRDELIRVIAPGGMLMIKTGNGWKKIVKPRPAGMDEWNQFLHDADNNGVSLDDVGAPQRLRWHDVPEFGRSKSISPSVTNMVSANGIVFTIEDRATTENVNAPVEYRLVARDAFNGIQLWSQPMQLWSNWQTFSIKSISTQQQRCLAAVGDYVYCCPEFGGPVTVFNARTGEQTKVFSETVRTREFAIENNVLYGIKGAPYAMDGHGDYRNNKTYALNLNTGTLKWNKKIAAEYVGGTLAVKGDYLVRYTSDGLTCMRADDGKIIWTQPIKPKSEKPRRSKNFSRQNSESEVVKYDSSALFSYNIHPTVVLTDDTVFVGVVDEIVAKNLRTGGTLWREPSLGNYRKSPDLFVAGGLVWGNSLKGHDPKTGKVVTQLTQEMTGPMSHDRCYRNRITHRYYLSSASGGIDLLELNGKSEQPNPWARSTCGLSAMPANGMIYNAPYVCQCIIGALVTGFNAMYNGSGNTDERFTVSLSPRLIKGPAFGFTGGGAATAGDWPAYRGSSMRSAVTDIEAPTQIAKKWKAEIGPHPTAPVVVGDSVYVASRETHTIVALNSTTGDKRWTFTAGGRIDSPPSYYRGLVVFGSRGGWVYCLRASDGELLWKFNGLPERRLICSSGQLESAWPVNGSVMVYQDTFYFAGGRSSFLDGGIAVFGLDPFTGQMKHGKMMQGPYQDNNRNFPIETGEFHLEGFKSGIFSSADNMLFIRHQAFKTDLTPVALSDVKAPHLMASPGFLDASPQHRTYWTVDLNLRYGGPTGKFGDGPAGDIIAFDGRQFYEIRGYPPGRNLLGRGKDMDPLSTYSVFSGSLVAKDEAGAWTGAKDSIPVAGSWKKRWNQPTPFAGHAIAASKTTVLVAGVPMLEGYSIDDTNASYAGEKGGIAWLLDANNGHKLQELRFEAAPVWDGIAIASKHYFICLKDGLLVCLSRK